MNIAFVVSESVPFAKTGGLADVAGTLPGAVKGYGHDVRVCMPKYAQVSAAGLHLKKMQFKLSVPVGSKKIIAAVWQGRMRHDVPVYFIEQESYFDREYLYGAPEGDYPDNDERFIFFNRAALELFYALKFKPDIIHCHDWQTGLIPAYLKSAYIHAAFYARTSSVFTIHNIAYQGLFEKNSLLKAGLSWNLFSMEGLEYYDKISFLKAGIVYADFITTVSPTYAHEIQTSREYGFGLEGVLKTHAKKMAGILNGIDYEEWNPQKDACIAETFDPPNNYEGKKRCKEDIQKIFNLQVSEKIPLFGIVSRLASQKGLDILTSILSIILRENIQLVILGTGDISYHQLLKKYAQAYTNVFGIALKFDNQTAHKIYAGSDFFLMPSHYEPCGLGQMIAMRYGAIPIVMKTGGLTDTVIDYESHPHKGNGVVFNRYEPMALVGAILRAMRYWNHPVDKKHILNHMSSANFTWENSAKQYCGLYANIRKNQKISTRI
ncbi:MAG: glycogen synthase GlgA [bacterium]